MTNIDDVQAALSAKSEARRVTENYGLTRRRTFYSRAGKRFLDLVLVLVALPIIVPAILLLAGLVMLDGEKPFFGHRRIGQGGKSFRCWKLRTMVPNAEDRLKEYLAANHQARKEWEANFKLTKDPRITRIGNFLRRSSLDELPQLWNIVKGEMSLVGPRPVTKDELAMYGRDVSYYQALRPGLTGLWQVSGRNDVIYSQRVELDVEYFKTFDMIKDIHIILGTFNAVLGYTGR